jgi:signal transduction histidine kinase
MNFSNNKRYYIIFIIISTIFISYLHYSTGTESHALHSIYAELYYIPILLGALFGLRGALLTYIFVSALYLPFIFISWTNTSLFLIDKLLHLLVTGLFAMLAGYLIDSQKRYQQQLERDKIELQKLDKLKSSFLANVSHELRTPMTAITGYTDLLLDQVDGPINDEQEKSLKKVATHSRQLIQLINNILDVSKMESGEKIQLQPKEIDLTLLVESVVATFKPIIKQKSLNLTVNMYENLSHIYADDDRIQQVMINLLSNAVKFTDKGSITIDVNPSTKWIIQGEKPLFAEICITDTGIGIKEEDINIIFDKFTQVDSFLNRQYEGTGLGLNIAKKMVEIHGGEIWVTSKYGEGSTFCFTIPLKKS